MPYGYNAPVFSGTSGYNAPVIPVSIPGYNAPSLNYGQPNPSTSTGPYPAGAPLSSSFQHQTFDIQSADRTKQISDIVNSINRNAQQSALSARIPNNPALEAKSSENIASELSGQVPQDVMNLLAQQAAERGVATGDVGGPNANAAYLRSLGLTSLEQQQVGQQNLSAADVRNPAAPIYDPSQQILTPYQGERVGLQGGGLNLRAFEDLMQNQLAQEKLALQQAQLYSNPSLNYGSPTTGNTLTGDTLFGADATGTGDTGGGYVLDQSAFSPLSGAYDFTPTSPLDSTSDYATTPLSAYG